MLLYMAGDANRSGYTRLCAAFWDECRSFDIALPSEDAVSGSAFCQARAKLSNVFLRSVLHQVSDSHDANFPDLTRWRGLRIFAIDGSKANVQRSDELRRKFGVPSGAHCPQILVSTLINVVSEVPSDVVVAPTATSERELLLQHLDRLSPGDVLLLDRGYPSFEILQLLRERGIDFVIRVPKAHTFSAVDMFLASGGSDYRVLIEPPDHSNPGAQPIEVRAVRTWSPKEDTIVFLTSLRRCDVTTMQVCELYRMRWRIEETFKVVKGAYLGAGQLHAKRPHGVVQEILAVMLFVAVSRFFAAVAAVEHDVPYDEVSIKGAILSLAAYVTRVMLCTDPVQAKRWLSALLQRVAGAREKRRPGRSFPRRSFKPSPRWGPGGRRGAS
jgi:hypothetical protein